MISDRRQITVTTAERTASFLELAWLSSRSIYPNFASLTSLEEAGGGRKLRAESPVIRHPPQVATVGSTGIKYYYEGVKKNCHWRSQVPLTWRNVRLSKAHRNIEAHDSQRNPYWYDATVSKQHRIEWEGNAHMQRAILILFLPT